MQRRSKHPLYQTWRGMIARCRNDARYVGAGIQVCERWLHDFDAFVADVGPKPSPKHSLDRFPRRRGNYEPGNVRWATASEQLQNQDRKKRSDYGGVLSTWVTDEQAALISSAASCVGKTVSTFLREATFAEVVRETGDCPTCGSSLPDVDYFDGYGIEPASLSP